MKLNASHLHEFRKHYPTPPTQGAVGKAPIHYLSILGQSVSCHFISSNKPLSRPNVSLICQDPHIDPLSAFACSMAWGGQKMNHFKMAIDNPKLSIYLNLLKSGMRRDVAFNMLAEAHSSEDLPGLGISFFTKLIYFFAPQQDGFILDQWTAKSACLLDASCPLLINAGGMPSSLLTERTYEWFCCAVEYLAKFLKWKTPDEVEIALFSKGGRKKGIWRQHVIESFKDADHIEPKLQPPDRIIESLARLATLTIGEQKTRIHWLPLPAYRWKKGRCRLPEEFPNPKIQENLSAAEAGLDDEYGEGGFDVFGIYECDTHEIVIDPAKCTSFARRYELPRDHVIQVVIIHELAHFVTHCGLGGPNKREWVNFKKASELEVERTAQAFTFLFLKNAEQRKTLKSANSLMKVFIKMSTNAPVQYRQWQQLSQDYKIAHQGAVTDLLAVSERLTSLDGVLDPVDVRGALDI